MAPALAQGAVRGPKGKALLKEAPKLQGVCSDEVPQLPATRVLGLLLQQLLAGKAVKNSAEPGAGG